jgi:purine-binding chemotaxis protein CheW
VEKTMDSAISLQMTAEELAEEKKEQLVNIDFKMVTFSLAGKDYAIDIMKVKEIAKAGRFTFVPNTAPFVLGVYNLRGDIIPIIDLRLFFNIEVPERTGNEIESMIIIGLGDQVFGIVVDGIDKVVGIQSSTIQPPHPLFGDINIKYIYGVVESNNRLYILLDIERIFGVKTATSEKRDTEDHKLAVVKQEIPDSPRTSVPENLSVSKPVVVTPAPVQNSVDEVPVSVAGSSIVTAPIVPETTESVDYTFIVESLRSFAKFNTSEVNENWVRNRFSVWLEEKGIDNCQLVTEADVNEFLKPFYSQYTDALWDKSYAESVYKSLPENNARQIQVWNPGCGKGYESYSLACLLHKRYPQAKIKIFAQDIDLINVSNAPLLTVSAKDANTWYKSCLTKTVSGEYTFSQEIKDMVFFEYHDCTNTNSIPMVDLIFIRDVLSFVSSDALENLYTDFEEKLKGNGTIIIGDNEVLADRSRWSEKTIGSLNIYNKQ